MPNFENFANTNMKFYYNNMRKLTDNEESEIQDNIEECSNIDLLTDENESFKEKSFEDSEQC